MIVLRPICQYNLGHAGHGGVPLALTQRSIRFSQFRRSSRVLDEYSLSLLLELDRWHCPEMSSDPILGLNSTPNTWPNFFKRVIMGSGIIYRRCVRYGIPT
jgi:hypothetical protein